MFWMNGALTSFSVNLTVYGSTFSIFVISLSRPMSVKYGNDAGYALRNGWFGSSMRLNVNSDVVRVEFAGRLEVRRGLELHAMTQMERVRQAIGRHVPLFRETRLDFRAAALEFDEAVIDGERVRGEIGARGVLGGIETGRTAF